MLGDLRDLENDVGLEFIKISGLVFVNFSFKVSPEKEISWIQIGAPRWPREFRSSADDSLFEMALEQLNRRLGRVTGGSILLEPGALEISASL